MASIESLIITFRRMHEAKIESGEMRETPGAVVEQTDQITSVLLKALDGSGSRAHKKERLKALFAASAVEDELVQKIKSSGQSLDEILNNLP